MFNKYNLHLIIILFITSTLFANDDPYQKKLIKVQSVEEQSFGQFNINRITSDFSNDGTFATQNVSGGSGMRFDGISINYCSGIWIADSSNGGIRIAAAEYGSEYSPGAFGVDYDSLNHGILSYNNTNGIIGDQSHWYKCNDGGTHTIFGTDPLNIELESTIWGYGNNYNNIKLQNVMFVKSIITNKGNSNLENAYIGIWSDPDLGYAGDDFVGCDTLLNLGYCYNDGQDDEFGENPPAIGIVLLQGPQVNSLGKILDEQQYLPMTSFSRFLASDPVYYDPVNAKDAFNLLTGIFPNGSPFYWTPPYYTYQIPGNPIANLGPNDSEYVDIDLANSGDRRFLMGSGPFKIAVGDSQEIIFAYVVGEGDNAFDSIRELKEQVQLIQYLADHDFDFTKLEISGNKTVPNDFRIYQNYPNPFNPSTTIKYYLPHSSNIDINIYNMNGEIVFSEVINNQKEGYNSFNWNGTNNIGDRLSSGIYFINIISDNIQQTKKMLLMK